MPEIDKRSLFLMKRFACLHLLQQYQKVHQDKDLGLDPCNHSLETVGTSVEPFACSFVSTIDENGT